MVRHQTNCHWAIELLEAAAIFASGIAIAAVAAVVFVKNGSIAIVLLGGLPTVLFFAIGFRVSSAALRKRRSASASVEGGEEDGTLLGIGAHAAQWHRDRRTSIQLPAIALAQLRESSPTKKVKVDGGVHPSSGGGEDCAVCLCKIGEDGVPTIKLPACRHVLHKDCIEQWLRVHPTCPICRCNVLRHSPEVILRLNS